MSIRVDWCRFVWIGVDSCGLVSIHADWFIMVHNRSAFSCRFGSIRVDWFGMVRNVVRFLKMACYIFVVRFNIVRTTF